LFDSDNDEYKNISSKRANNMTKESKAKRKATRENSESWKKNKNSVIIKDGIDKLDKVAKQISNVQNKNHNYDDKSLKIQALNAITNSVRLVMDLDNSVSQNSTDIIDSYKDLVKNCLSEVNTFWTK
jgi:hypothetical protein